MVNYFIQHFWIFCCIGAVIWVVIVYKKDDKEQKRYDVTTTADQTEMKKRLKQSLKNKGGGDVDLKGKRGGFVAENNEWYTDVSLGPRSKKK